jgi:hypothetical protein
MHNSLKIIKTLLYSYSALHISGTFSRIIRSVLILHIHPPVTVCPWCGCIFQLWSVTCRAEQEYNKVLMILRLLCIWLVFYSLLSSLMHGTMNLKFRFKCLRNHVILPAYRKHQQRTVQIVYKATKQQIP